MPRIPHRALAFGAATVLATALAAAPAAAAPHHHNATQIVVTEQRTDQILVLDNDPEDWAASRIAWRWKPTADNGFADLTGAWGLPDEAKLESRAGQRYLLTSDSHGLVAVVPYPQGAGSYWATDVTAAANPHTLELLPDGNVAVVASTGGWLRIYTASQGNRATAYVQVDLPAPHGVVWDGVRKTLWVLDDDNLHAMRLGGTPAAPTVTEQYSVALPSKHGHDLQPVPGQPNRLWLTTGSAVYQYDKGARGFRTDYPAADQVNQVGVKSVGTSPDSGQVLSTTVQAGNPCTWCTDTVGLFRPRTDRTLPDSQIYKARWWAETH